MIPFASQSATHTAKMHRILESLQPQFNDSVAHETIGLSEIVKQCTGWPPNVPPYGSVVYFQNVREHSHMHTQGRNIGLRSVLLDRSDPPEPPHLNVLPHGDEKYTLELLVHEEGAVEREAWSKILDRMVLWLSDLSLG